LVGRSDNSALLINLHFALISQRRGQLCEKYSKGTQAGIAHSVQLGLPPRADCDNESRVKSGAVLLQSHRSCDGALRSKSGAVTGSPQLLMITVLLIGWPQSQFSFQREPQVRVLGGSVVCAVVYEQLEATITKIWGEPVPGVNGQLGISVLGFYMYRTPMQWSRRSSNSCSILH